MALIGSTFKLRIKTLQNQDNSQTVLESEFNYGLDVIDYRAMFNQMLELHSNLTTPAILYVVTPGLIVAASFS